ncbi:hypothetical protein [Acetobacter nitrogenifigens]|uniref:hypothetical protein n=1 Tax=Acetobacter nitrogenifigens TaxID=285268 RepID=UPI0004193AB4|nr:hypothetical protein [Acetobacter nitrogenifigens]
MSGLSGIALFALFAGDSQNYTALIDGAFRDAEPARLHRNADAADRKVPQNWINRDPVA